MAEVEAHLVEEGEIERGGGIVGEVLGGGEEEGGQSDDVLEEVGELAEGRTVVTED